VSVGAGGFVAVNGSDPEVPPPGAGVVTVRFTTPAVAMLDAGMVAISSVEPWYWVGMLVPLTAAVELGVNPVPVNVTNIDWLMMPVLGLMDVSAGTGAVEIVTVIAFETAGVEVVLLTVMVAVPDDANRLAGTVAVMNSGPELGSVLSRECAWEAGSEAFRKLPEGTIPTVLSPEPEVIMTPPSPKLESVPRL